MLGVGVIGCGYWGPNLIRNFAETPGARLVSVCDLNADRLTPLQARYPTLQLCSKPEQILNDPAIGAVVIVTPVRTHFDLALRALKAGKHVLVTKPMTTTAAEATQLIQEAGRRGLVLMVDHTFIYTGAVKKIKELVDARELGKLYYYDSVRVNLGLFQHDVNVLWDLAVHDLAIMDHVLGFQPTAVSATGIAHVAGEPENIAYLTCFFENNFIAHFHVNWLAPVKIRHTLLGGDRKMIVYNDLEPDEKVKIYDKGVTIKNRPEDEYKLLVDYRTGDMWVPKLDRTEALLVETTHFVDCVASKKTPLTDGHAGLRVVRILEAASESLRQSGKPITLKD